MQPRGPSYTGCVYLCNRPTWTWELQSRRERSAAVGFSTWRLVSKCSHFKHFFLVGPAKNITMSTRYTGSRCRWVAHVSVVDARWFKAEGTSLIRFLLAPMWTWIHYCNFLWGYFVDSALAHGSRCPKMNMDTTSVLHTLLTYASCKINFYSKL